MKTLTVITTTYNRAYCLHQVYESLCRQTCDDFLWLIIDDGSTDNTKEFVEQWISEEKVEIEYYYKPNGGMHTARNLAYEKVCTELNVIIDSDDWMTDDGVEKITTYWAKNGAECYSGVVFNNISPKGIVIGSELPKHIKSGTVTELKETYHVKGDKKLVYRSELTKLYPYPEFEGEKFFPPSLKFRLIDLKYDMLYCNFPVCVVDYNDDSMTHDKFAQYRNSAKGFAYYRNEVSSISKSPKFVIRQMIHYVAESKLAGDKNYFVNAHKKGYVLLCWVPGSLLYLYLIKTKRKY